jgi:4'-phosphopantetheinyl transferase
VKVVTSLPTAVVQVKLVSLRVSPDELARLQRFLSVEELQRAKRLVVEERREQFVVGRGKLRELLGEQLGEDPGSIRISQGEFGKPHLSDHLEPDALSFNLSHAGDFMLVAFAAGREIGIDLEQLRPGLDFRPIAKRYFSEREQADLFSLPESEQLPAFYRCWTRKEAYIKATGTGFSQPSNGFDVSLLPGEPSALLAHRVRPGDVAKWKLYDLEAPEGYCAALAVEAGGKVRVQVRSPFRG